ncbi:histidinol-phosphatase [Oceanicaulis sp. MMSF_3324]|uniref:histidinol-phosphatase n=1 Tax=Oceanicaulis sp. MMSF_3324 TaxID=3046702 RepID=UPI00273D510B|nr:histidinol-phosphatase [Oceanicaulis sp. MMSF_3324]
MPDLDVSAELALAAQLADAARPIALQHFRTGLHVDAKPAHEFDPVTEADRAIEARIRAILAEARPEDGVLGEEQAETLGQSGRTWVVDPIDGTRAFIAGLPTWCVLIALYGPDGPLLSVIDQPFTGERFSGVTGQGAWLDHGGSRQSLRTRPAVTRVEDAILSTTDPGLFEGAEADCFSRLAQAAKVRRYGLDAYAYAALAAGGVDLVIESGLKPWDVGALIPVVTGAGGVITNWRGGPAHEGGQMLAAATPQLHAQALEQLAAAAL